MLEVVEDRRVGRSRLGDLLNDLDKRKPHDGVTVCSKAGGFQDSVQSAITMDGLVPGSLSMVAPSLEASETGCVLFWSQEGGVAVLPPFPMESQAVLAGWDTSPLRALLVREYVIGVVLLRLGRFSIGVFQGDKLVSSKTDTRYVKGRHSAGGTSQKRFQRIREKQVHELFKKTCTIVKGQFTPFESRLDYILMGGEKFTLQGLRKECDYLQRLSPRILGRVLNVRKPKHAVLEGLIDEIWESRVVRIGRVTESQARPGV